MFYVVFTLFPAEGPGGCGRDFEIIAGQFDVVTRAGYLFNEAHALIHILDEFIHVTLVGPLDYIAPDLPRGRPRDRLLLWHPADFTE